MTVVRGTNCLLTTRHDIQDSIDDAGEWSGLDILVISLHCAPRSNRFGTYYA